MNQSIRPVASFVVRLWREPGDPAGGLDWRGLVRPLAAKTGPLAPVEVPFQGLDQLAEALRSLLAGPDQRGETSG